jgi:hypothetical protein
LEFCLRPLTPRLHGRSLGHL